MHNYKNLWNEIKHSYSKIKICLYNYQISICFFFKSFSKKLPEKLSVRLDYMNLELDI